MLTLMRDEARGMAGFWERKLNECLDKERRQEMAERRRLADRQIRDERPRRRQVTNVAETARVESDEGTDSSEGESGGAQ